MSGWGLQVGAELTDVLLILSTESAGRRKVKS